MIAVISDSHIPARAEKIPGEFSELMDEADKVIHCGDFEIEEIYRKLEARYDHFIGVKGNNDFFEVPVSTSFEYEDLRFGVYHGSGIRPRGHAPTLAENARKLDVDILFHGHTHVQAAEKEDGKILLNPGSCTGLGRSGTGIPKMMAVEVEGDQLWVELICLENGELEREERSFDI